MIPLIAASFFLSLAQGGTQAAKETLALPVPTTATVPDNVREWEGFGFLPAGPRTFPLPFPTAASWSALSTAPNADAAAWRTKVVILDRIDRTNERGGSLVWPGHHSLPPAVVAKIKRALPQLRALAAHLSKGACNLSFDILEEPDPISAERGGLGKVVADYLTPRINGGRYNAEDGIFRGPYQSVLVIHPVGGETVAPLTVQGTPVEVVGVADILGEEVDGGLAAALAQAWVDSVRERAAMAGFESWSRAGARPSTGNVESPLPYAANQDWTPLLAGADASTEARRRLLGIEAKPTGPTASGLTLFGQGAAGIDTTVRISDDAQKGKVLVVEELGYFRTGGFALPRPAGDQPVIDVTATPTFNFWMKSDALDPVVVQFLGKDSEAPFSVKVGVDVPFAYDGMWHAVKIDLKPSAMKSIQSVLIAPDLATRQSLRQNLGPIVASFAEFRTSTDAPDAKPAPETPGPTALTPEARALWAATAEPGEPRRLLFKDPNEAVRANALASALARPDAADEAALIDAALYNYDPTVFGPAIQALGKLSTATAQDALRRTMRAAASDRARGLAAEILSASHDSKLVPLILPLNQARSRGARISAIRALGAIPGSESALMRMAFLPQDDPQIKLETTLTIDVNDDYQGRKALWSAVNEPSDAVRLESLRRLSYSTVAEFRAEGLKGVRDDSVGVRVGLLEAWTTTPNKAFLPSIQLALTDRSARVRAAALGALASATEPIDEKELTAAFADPDPLVSLAVLKLAKARNIAVPTDVKERLRNSPDPRVRAAVGE